MTSARKFVVSLLLLTLLLLLQGCNKKKASLPRKLQAPTIAVVLPDEIPLEEAPEEPARQVAEVPVTPPPVKAKPNKKQARTPAKKATPPVTAAVPPPPQTAPGNQTVATLRPPHNPATEGAPETAIVAAIPSEQVTHQREDTARMVDATENTLKGINRQLNDEEKSMRSQIQSYLQQSRKATTDGDYERAYNLAKKAQLLAEALIKK